MILLNFGQASEFITVTLNEKRTLDNGYYLFRFTHQTTKQVINFIASFLTDDSDYQDRYNRFEINTASVFGSAPVGLWTYNVYEQASAVNTNPEGLTEVENGIMQLEPSSEFSPTEYSPSTSFTAYGG